MEDHVRAAIAAAALAHSKKIKLSSVYSYSESRYRSIEAAFSGAKLTGYDYDSGCHFDGSAPNLYHYGVGSHVEFNVKSGGHYDGYDYHSSSHFEVKVVGNEAEVYDYGSSAFFSYST